MSKCSKLCDSMKNIASEATELPRQPGTFSFPPRIIVPEVDGMAVQLVVAVISKMLKGSDWKDKVGMQTSSQSLWNVMKREQPVSVRLVPVHRSRVTLYRCSVPNHCLSALSVLHQADHLYSLYLMLPVSTLGWKSRSPKDKVLKSLSGIQILVY